MIKQLLLVLFFLPCMLFAQQFDSLCRQQLLVIGDFKAMHFSPPEFDLTTNKQIFDIYKDDVDPHGIFLFESDIAALNNSINDNSDEEAFLPLMENSFKIIKNRLKQIDSVLLVLEKKSFQYTNKDTITYMADASNWKHVSDLKSLQNRIERKLKVDCLRRFSKPIKEGENVLKLDAKELATRQDDAKKKAIQRFRKYLENFNSDYKLKHHVADNLSNAIALRCDPHSSYFNVVDKESWDSGLSMQEFSFGFSVDEGEAGEIVLTDLIPGGPAWKSNELHEGDVLLSFKFENETEVDLSNADIEDYYVFFYKSSAKNVELTFRRKDNQVQKVKLRKAKIQSQENVMNSYIMKKDGLNFGYIPIPAFYSDDELDSRQGCANDVAKEIVKLKQDTISGLILDLRYNGGGSMKEAMGLAGIFIDEGPLAVYSQRGAKPVLMKDFNRGTIYDGPLIVMINSASASASEFLTATLQDYGRAVIVGTPSYGKGTAQSVYSADTSIVKIKGELAYNDAYGYTKITIAKFYRVTRQSHQGKGIQPDIKIPDLVEKLIPNESTEAYFLPCDSVNKKVVFNKLEPLPLNDLRELSSERIAKNQKFNQLIHLRDSLYEASKKDLKIVLTLQDYIKYTETQDKLDDKLDELSDPGEEATLIVKNNVYQEKLVGFDDFEKKINEEKIETIKRDINLQETILILKDLNSYIKNK